MPISFLMRQDINTSHSLKALNNIIRADGNELILSTGYVNLDLLTNPINRFKSSFTEWFNKATSENKLKLTIVGGMIKHKAPPHARISCDYYVCNKIDNKGCIACAINTKNHQCKQYSFKQFIELVESWIPTSKKSYVTIQFARAKNNQYHAKVALKYMNDKPVMAICGSSNLTKAALEEHYTYYNCEADMLVYTKQSQLFKFIDRKKYLDDEDTNEDVRELIKDLYDNIQNISKMLSSLADEKDNKNREWSNLLYNFMNSNQDYNLLINDRNNSKIKVFYDEAVNIKREIEYIETRARSNVEIIKYGARTKVCEQVLINISNMMQSYIVLNTKNMIKNSLSEYGDNWYI